MDESVAPVHQSEPVRPASKDEPQSNGSQPKGNCSSINSGKGVRMRRLPVLVRTMVSDESYETYALLDSGSDVTLCDNKLVEELQLRGPKRNFLLTTQEKENSDR